MGNCLYPKKNIIESFSLVNNDGEIWHIIDTNKEHIDILKKRLINIEQNNDHNFKTMADDIKTLNRLVQSRLSHHSLSKYGGNESLSIQADLDGPSLINFSTS